MIVSMILGELLQQVQQKQGIQQRHFHFAPPCTGISVLDRHGAEAMASRRIVALRHMSGDGAIKRRRVVIAAHPVAALSPLEVIVFGWWRRRGRGRPGGPAEAARG